MVFNMQNKLWPLPGCLRQLILVTFMLFLISCANAGTTNNSQIRGTLLTEGSEIPSVTLSNQHNELLSPINFEGQVIILTFLYTSCTNVCPVVANQIKYVYQALANESDLEVVIISVDPSGDNVESTKEFLDRFNMNDDWSYLIGDERDLRQMWDAYYVDPVTSIKKDSKHQATSTTKKHTSAKQGLIQESLEIIHSTPIYLIDKKGIAKILYTTPFEVEDMIHDVEYLINQKNR